MVIGWFGGDLAPPEPADDEADEAENTQKAAPARKAPRHAAKQAAAPSKAPVKILIAALGGEGGGVLTNWIVSAAAETGFPVQSTSIPGVAQRTGATTYYIEILPVHVDVLGSQRPVLALTPGVGDIDVAVASELMEAARTVAGGFVTAERTHVIASTGRFYAMDEKTAMADGRFDQNALTKTIKQHANDTLLIDMAALARDSGSIINAVMLGAIAGSERLPLSVAQLEAAIKADGKSVEANLRGFHAGLEAARAKAGPAPVAHPKHYAQATRQSLEHHVAWTFPALAQPVASEGVRRLVPYQNTKYARLYLERLKPVLDADEAASAHGRLLKEVARHLAVRMSYEDVVRVAQAKIDPARMRRIAREELGATREPFAIYEFLKPGIEEMTQLLPPFVARPVLWLARKRGWLGRVYFGMEINSTSISGFLRLLLLAKLRAVRPFGYRYKQEQKQIEEWLALIRQAAARSINFAIEIAECARLIKGYGDTHARGLANYALIETHIIRPVLAGDIPLQRGADAVGSARAAALVDPEGESLARCLEAIENHDGLPIAAE
jgi:indolepyruvate ferredoxin oxidoreductase beta subunit